MRRGGDPVISLAVNSKIPLPLEFLGFGISTGNGFLLCENVIGGTDYGYCDEVLITLPGLKPVQTIKAKFNLFI